MLSRPDDELIRRDPAIPGLRSLLDGEAFTDLLREAFPGLRGATAQPAYVRYKPGTRCLVAYTIDGASAVTHVHANAYSRERWHEQRLSTRPSDDGSGAPLRAARDDLAIVVACFPFDQRLKTLGRLWDPAERPALLRKTVGGYQALHAAVLETLAYKPGRRFVGLLTAPEARAVVKLYAEGVSASARAADKRLHSAPPLRIARCIGRSRRHRAVVFEWLAGERLSEMLLDGHIETEHLVEVGAALAELHRQLGKSAEAPVPQDMHVLVTAARAVAALRPALAGRAVKSTRAIAAALDALDSPRQPIHSDFHAGQVLIGRGGAGILDLDRAAWGDPAFDLGNLVAHLECDVIDGTLAPHIRDAAATGLIRGYEGSSGMRIADAVPLHTASALLRLGARPFRARAPNWDERMATILDRADALLAGSRVSGRLRGAPSIAGVSRAALDARTLERQLAQVPRLQTRGQLCVRAVRVVRHKPGRRALIEYDLEPVHSRPGNCLTVLAKVRMKGFDARVHHLVEALWNAGFDSGSSDGISVPEPVGIVPHLRMSIQRKVVGTVASDALSTRESAAVARRAAEVIHKLHRAGAPAFRRHSIDDELSILKQRLSLVADDRPAWRPRLDALFEACRDLADALPSARTCGIHRDFHPGQLMVNGDRAFLLDLDLYAWGDPALDAGNFLAHIAEYSLREFGDADRLASSEAAFTARFLELASDVPPASIDAYRSLSLARHVQISTTFADRRPFTESILEYCESRLGLPAV